MEESFIYRFCELYRVCLEQTDIFSTMWCSQFEDCLFHYFCPNLRVAVYDDMAFPID